MVNLTAFLTKIKASEKVDFKDTISVIDEYYEFTPTSFNNGSMVNEAGKNSGSCKLFAFAKSNKLNQEQTLACFGDYYTMDVLQNPEGTDHQNIRNFMKTGWDGITFEGMALKVK